MFQTMVKMKKTKIKKIKEKVVKKKITRKKVSDFFLMVLLFDKKLICLFK